ncbi:hypothetical protein WA158_004104 [Blastocystis sp. Blastoise]
MKVSLLLLLFLFLLSRAINLYEKALYMHPDKINGDQDIEQAKTDFMMLVKAYEILSDSKRRQDYDQNGLDDDATSSLTDQYTDYPFRFQSFSKKYVFDFEYTPKRASKATAIYISVNVTLENLYTGKVISLNVTNYMKCHHCNGTGARDVEDAEKCPLCHGTGFSNHIYYDHNRGYMYKTRCKMCSGSGFVSSTCPICNGKKLVQNTIPVTLTIPSGSYNGKQFTLSSSGNFEFLKERGDVTITLNALPHPLFTNIDNSLYISHHISLSQSILPSESLSIPLLNGTQFPIKIQKPIQNNTQLIYEKMGINSRGKLYITLIIDYPEYVDQDDYAKYSRLLTKEQRISLDTIISYQYIRGYLSALKDMKNIDDYLYTYKCPLIPGTCSNDFVLFLRGINPLLLWRE